MLDDAIYALHDNGYIISREDSKFNSKNVEHPDIVILTSHRNDKETIVMLGKAQKINPVYVKIYEDPEFSWLTEVQSALKNHNEVVVYSEHEPLTGTLGFINCLKREPETKSVRAVVILDEDKTFDANELTFSEQLKKNLAINIFKNGKWGTYRHFPINTNEEFQFRHTFVNQVTVGDISSIRWMAGPHHSAELSESRNSDRMVEVSLYYLRKYK